ncbi:MAG TPA: hypothetical protein VNA30_03045 [Mycobacteriales bacterium]|nr:hypothetical protein [Mycobacteriales bacterium]
MNLVRPLVGLAALALAAGVAAPAIGAPAKGKACPAPPKLTYAEPMYVDKTRAGGEPLVATHPSGRLMYSTHAGTTHFYTPTAGNPGSAAFAQNYQGQTYIWTSDDDGKTWVFRPRVGGLGSEGGTQGAPGSGFSDPEFAIDSAGAVYFSEINLANVAVSKSNDRSATYNLQNFFGAVLTDRQWMEADRKNELYFTANAFGGGTGTPNSVGDLGHYIAKSKDGGKTFSKNIPNNVGGPGMGDLRVDKRNGTLYESHFGAGKLSVNAFRNARKDVLTATDSNLVAESVSMLNSVGPAIDVGPKGHVYITWDESGKGDRDEGIYYAYSNNNGRKWSAPIKVSSGDETAIWPWLAVGDEGRVAISWLEADTKLPNHNAETPGTHGWRIHAAATLNGLGCKTSKKPGFSTTIATKTPVHKGTICSSGTTCQAQLVDRRLGDYFSMDIDEKGRAYIGYSDTQVPASVSLPGFVRQSGGPVMLAKPKK